MLPACAIPSAGFKGLASLSEMPQAPYGCWSLALIGHIFNDQVSATRNPAPSRPNWTLCLQVRPCQPRQRVTAIDPKPACYRSAFAAHRVPPEIPRLRFGPVASMSLLRPGNGTSLDRVANATILGHARLDGCRLKRTGSCLSRDDDPAIESPFAWRAPVPCSSDPTRLPAREYLRQLVHRHPRPLRAPDR